MSKKEEYILFNKKTNINYIVGTEQYSLCKRTVLFEKFKEEIVIYFKQRTENARVFLIENPIPIKNIEEYNAE